MRRTGALDSPLHGGHCPPWLFAEMVRLSAALVEAMVVEYGTEVALTRFSDPIWFQSFGSLLGFDWHSSGLTTVALAALKEGMRDRSADLGFFIAGGKGRTSLKTPDEITEASERHGLASGGVDLVRCSRLAAKVDSAAVQDGYQIYHHVFLFDKSGNWVVVQQGLSESLRRARRYHWNGTHVDRFSVEPHSGIAGVASDFVLDLTARLHEGVRTASLELAAQPSDVKHALALISEGKGGALTLPRHHAIPASGRIDKALQALYERPPADYDALLATKGVGPGALRALAMTAELIHGAEVSYHDPVRFAFAHGGKDGTPFPVRRDDYRSTVQTLHTALAQARIGKPDRLKALKRLSRLQTEAERAGA